ncbi:MAG: hypothetical protein K2O32_08675 [Acetatifactor sp.]|nr:hypothetical protein [Acetatifactor sp.]
MKKKVLSALLSATLIVSMLAGCGGNDTPTTGSSTPAPSEQGSSAAAVENNNNDTAGGAIAAPATDGWDDSKKIYAYAWDEDFGKKLNVVLDKYPQYKDYVEYINLGMSGTDGKYQDAVDTAFASGDKYPSLIPADNDVALWWAEDDDKTLDLGSIGLTADLMGDAYQFSIDYGTCNGKLKAVTWQGTPGSFTYRRDIAQEVFGVSEPADVQALVKDWDTFFDTAAKLKEKGYYIVSGPDDIKYPVFDGQSSAWVTVKDGTEYLTLDDSVNKYLEYSLKLYNEGLTNNTTAWSGEWFANMQGTGKVFGYFGTTWFMAQIHGQSHEGDTPSFGQWGAVTGPCAYHWGGTYVMVGKDTPNPELCAFLLYEMTCNAETMYDITVNTGDFVNNKAANEKLVADGDSVALYMDDGKGNKDTITDLLGGQNPIQAWAEAAPSISLKNLTYQDAKIKSVIDKAATSLWQGEYKTVDEAIAFVKTEVATQTGLVAE